MKLKFSTDQVKLFLHDFLPSKEILIVCILFYILGMVFAFMNPGPAHLTFPGGMFLDHVNIRILTPKVITFNYFLNQFFYFLGIISLFIFLKNLALTILSILSGFAILPVILIGLFMKMGTITFFTVEKLEFKGILVIIGSLHIYFEFLAALLAIETFFKFYSSIIKSILKRDIYIFRNSFLNEFIPSLVRIMLLLAIAAFLEVFWSTWWVYILTHPYIPWHDFYFDLHSVLN